MALDWPGLVAVSDAMVLKFEFCGSGVVPIKGQGGCKRAPIKPSFLPASNAIAML